MQRHKLLLIAAIVAVLGWGALACSDTTELEERVDVLEEKIDVLIEDTEAAATTPIVIQAVNAYIEGRRNNRCTEALPIAVSYVLSGREEGFCAALESDCYKADPTIGEPLPKECR